MLILRYFAGLMAWLTIAAVNLGLAGCALYCYYQSGRLSAVRGAPNGARMGWAQAWWESEQPRAA
jgi:hypothetical protein